jgi:hypothetical protein
MTDKEKQNDFWSWGGGQQQSLVWGFILILMGGFFLLRNYTGIELDNWWALFILFPAVSSFTSAYNAYRSSGTIDKQVRSGAFWGLFFVLLSASFLLSLDFGLIWPVFLILGGIAMLLGGV